MNTQHAMHVTDYYLAKAIEEYRRAGACQRKANRRLRDDEFDDNQFSIENGEGEIY